MKRIFIIPALAAVLLLSACDDGGREFADGVNKAQNTAATTINSKVATGTPAEIRQTAVQAFTREASDIQKLKAPEKATDERDTLVRTLRSAATTLTSDGKLNLAYLDATAKQIGAQIEDLNRAF